jgi:hypothetical protein
MRLKPFFWLTLISIFSCAASSALAQSVPDAGQRQLPLAVGLGLSGFNPDQGHGHMAGGTLWIDYSPIRIPWYLRGIGIEAEARDLNYMRSPTLSPDLREDTVLGALIYSWPHYRKIRPYGKLSEGLGNRDDESGRGKRFNDSRTILGCGGGVEYQLRPLIWLRADYEYQSWPNVFKHPGTTIPPGRLNPQGFSIGVMYHFSHPNFR